jgi:branched-chain amino acid transport system substrate-binding protein
MRRRVLARGRAACTCAVIAAGIAGCTSSSAANSTVAVSGNQLTLYVSAAPTDQPQVAQDVLDAERLAFLKGPTRVGQLTIRLATVRSSTISAQARVVIQDKTAIAYLGEVVPQSSYQSIGITNALDILQVSPTDTALDLTQATPAVPNAPDSFYQSLSTYKQTFARVVPTTADEAKAQVQEMKALGVTKLYVGSDGGPYGAAIAYSLKQDAGTGGLTVVGSPASADGVFYGSDSPAAAARFFNGVAGSNPSAKLFGASALDAPSFVSALSPSVKNLYVSVPGFLTADLSPAGRAFVSAFTAAYDHSPAPQAIFGYEAMAAVLSVLKEAGAAANNRTTVVKDFFSIKNRQSVLGTYSINSTGDTSIAPFVFTRLKGGQLVPVTFVSVG